MTRMTKQSDDTHNIKQSDDMHDITVSWYKQQDSLLDDTHDSQSDDTHDLTHNLMMCGWRKSLRFWISLLIFPTTSRLFIFCRFRIFTATLWLVNWCVATVRIKKSKHKCRAVQFPFHKSFSMRFICKIYKWYPTPIWNGIIFSVLINLHKFSSFFFGIFVLRWLNL